MMIRKNFVTQFAFLVGMVAFVTAANASDSDLVGVWDCDVQMWVDSDGRQPPEILWKPMRRVLKITERTDSRGKTILERALCNVEEFEKDGSCTVSESDKIFALEKVTSKKTGFDGYCLKEKSTSNRNKCWYGYKLDMSSDEPQLFHIANPKGQNLVHTGRISYRFPDAMPAGTCALVTGAVVSDQE